MQGGLNSNTRGSAYATATSVDPATGRDTGQPVAQREAVRLGSVSLTMEELLAIAVIANALGTMVALYLEVSD
ncbi:hypothetical protein [Halorubellus litoreus]|uniref:Uncharacterized protein n=1 Tax=Halorubellus litoreus TaxID=755308 RepID=A0ABD5VEL0_9EURY